MTADRESPLEMAKRHLAEQGDRLLRLEAHVERLHASGIDTAFIEDVLRIQVDLLDNIRLYLIALTEIESNRDRNTDQT